MKVLDKRDTNEYELFLNLVKFSKLDCWKLKAPKGFDKA
jgi:hypothetical protein